MISARPPMTRSCSPCVTVVPSRRMRPRASAGWARQAAASPSRRRMCRPPVGTDPATPCCAEYRLWTGPPQHLRHGLPDCGAILAALEAATGARAEAVVGKPSPFMAAAVLDRLGTDAGRTLLVGDRLGTDIRMARAAGCAPRSS